MYQAFKRNLIHHYVSSIMHSISVHMYMFEKAKNNHMHMSAYVYVCMYVCMYTSMYSNVYMCMGMYVCTDVCMSTYKYIYRAHTLHMRRKDINACMHLLIYICMCMYLPVIHMECAFIYMLSAHVIV